MDSQSPPRNATRVPSGDHATASSARRRSLSEPVTGAADAVASGSASPRQSRGNSTSGVPSVTDAEIRYTPGPPVQDSDANAIDLLSGDQDGPDAVRVVSRRFAVPSAFMVHSRPPLRNASCLPSGDQRGREYPPSAVSRVSVAPLLTYTLPPRT